MATGIYERRSNIGAGRRLPGTSKRLFDETALNLTTACNAVKQLCREIVPGLTTLRQREA
jgi:hypothetical protein